MLGSTVCQLSLPARLFGDFSVLIRIFDTPKHNPNCFTPAPLVQVQLLIWRKNDLLAFI